MKYFYLVVIALAAIVFASCETGDDAAQDNLGVSTQSAEFIKTKMGIDSITANWLKSLPVYNVTRTDQEGMIVLPTTGNARLSIVEADLAGARIGKKYGPWGAVIGAASASAIAYATKHKYYKSVQFDVDWGIVKEQNVVFPKNESTSTTLDSVGYYHNQIIRQIGEDKIMETDIENIENLVIETAQKLYGKDVVSFSDKQLKEDPDYRFLIKNMEQIVKTDNADAFYKIMEGAPGFNKGELDILKSYIQGLNVVDNTNGAYSNEVLKYIDKTDLNTSTKESLKSGILVGNASNRLWDGK